LKAEDGKIIECNLRYRIVYHFALGYKTRKTCTN